eukprot:TRINITY_DN58778_c0_g1_i1.p1 TRINITY_DN58778_c0_g1~~TRINITY_DN58778_c0_g1_i1.p1  ORF type:complete len:479 (-),score=20.08 TRINITY_DN58778_c0_g1_i1:363-1799(-)
MKLLLNLLSLRFCFENVAASIVGAQWAYVFNLSFPQQASILGFWSAYAAIMTLTMPLLKANLAELATREGPNSLASRTTLYGIVLLMMLAAGPTVGTCWSGVVSLLFSDFSDLSRPGPSGFGIAATVTCVFVGFHLVVESYLDNSTSSPKSFCNVLRTTLLNSLWGSLAFFWNAVWNRFIAKMNHPVPPTPAPTPPPGDHVWERPKFKPIIDRINGRREGGDGPGYQGLVVKACITLPLALLVIAVLPEPESSANHRALVRRLLLTVRMMILLVCAYSITDVGYYFGTKFVADYVGSDTIGVMTAFGYAVVVTLVVGCVGRRVRYSAAGFRSKTGRWLFNLALWCVSYAWWYPWQEVLYLIQGFGLPQNFGWPWQLTATLLLTVAVIGIGALTIRYLAAFMTERPSCSPDSPSSFALGQELSEASEMSRLELLFLLKCCGVHATALEDLRSTELEASRGLPDISPDLADGLAVDDGPG